MSLPQPLKQILNQDGFIIFIDGKKGSGKTNLAMLLNEICFYLKFRTKFASNIETECYYMKKIDNYPDLEDYLQKEHGKKTYTLDEAGKHIKRLRFMSEQNTKFMDLLQLIRHYDAGFIGVAPSAKFIDSNFLNTDILDVRIRKLSLQRVKIYDYVNDDVYFWNDLPKTTIIHNSKSIAPFVMQKSTVTAESRKCCQIAADYARGWTFQALAQKYGYKHRTEVMRELREHLKHSLLQVTNKQVVDENIETDSTL